MDIIDLVVGKPIKTSDERAEQIGPAQGIPISQRRTQSRWATGRWGPATTVPNNGLTKASRCIAGSKTQSPCLVPLGHSGYTGVQRQRAEVTARAAGGGRRMRPGHSWRVGDDSPYSDSCIRSYSRLAKILTRLWKSVYFLRVLHKDPFPS